MTVKANKKAEQLPSRELVITRTFDALFSGKLLAAETLQRMLTLVPLPGLREPPMVIDGAIDTGIGCHSSFGFAGAVRRRRAKRGPRAS